MAPIRPVSLALVLILVGCASPTPTSVPAETTRPSEPTPTASPEPTVAMATVEPLPQAPPPRTLRSAGRSKDPRPRSSGASD